MLKAGGRPGLEEQSEKHFADARRALIAGKELLSRKQSHTFRFELGDGPLEFTWRAEQFEEFIASPVERAVSQVKRLVEKAMAASVTLDGIILIGGSSKIPMVERRIDEVTGIKILKYDHSQEAVARGAALIAHARVSQTVAAIAVGHAEQSDLAQIPQWVVQTAAHPVAQIPKSAVALIPRPVSLPPARIGVLITTLVVVLLAVGSAGWWFGIEEPRRDRKTTALRLMEDQERATKERQDLAAAQAQLEAERERKAKINDELKNARSALGIKAVQLLHEAAQKGELPPQVVVDALQHADTLTAEQVQDLCARERTRRAEETLRSIAPAARPPQRDAVTLTKSVAVLLPSGQVNLPAGTILRYFGTEGPNARVSWNNNDFFVPANTTDIYDSPAAPASPGAQEMASSHASSPLAKPLEDLRTAGKPREFKAGDLVEITRAAPLSYNGKTYRDAAIGDRFKVLAYRPVEKRVYLVLRGSDGQDIAVAVEDDAVTVVPLPERAIAAARLGQIKEAAVLIQAAINTAPGNMELAEIQRTVLAVAKATEDMASANQQRAFAMREATNLEHGAAAIDRPNALFPKDTSNQMHAEVMRRQAQRLLDESETALRTAKENYDAKIAALRDLKGTSTRTTDAARTPAMLGASPSGGIPGLDPTPGAASPAGDRF